ncbi:hypothetical protein M408DRAFT_98348 [Serendipita vermifera MAFF 305830]|uniref:Uncharacterized protein n=1 Tax=Serendipita vermifera MAFF 305830 TaxID=933852 RepID=A0A0C3BEL0_SERVB|nr:hypothetical protein M408DRAFT_98348 [Serendipita vermifera MAFF 305830]
MARKKNAQNSVNAPQSKAEEQSGIKGRLRRSKRQSLGDISSTTTTTRTTRTSTRASTPSQHRRPASRLETPKNCPSKKPRSSSKGSRGTLISRIRKANGRRTPQPIAESRGLEASQVTTLGISEDRFKESLINGPCPSRILRLCARISNSVVALPVS